MLTRKREGLNQFSENNLYDLKLLLVREFSSLDSQEKEFIKNIYKNNEKKFIEELIINWQIVPFAANILYRLDCDKEFWKKTYERFIERNTSIKKILDEVFIKLNENNCKSVTLTENYAVVLLSKICIGNFGSGDVDLSADISEREVITKSLNTVGFFSKEQPKIIGEYSGQSMQFFNENILDDGFWINIIWKPVTRAFLIQDKYDKRLKEDRKNAIILDGYNIRILEKTSLLYFCALHISAGHYFTLTPDLRLYIDIDRLVRNVDIDWDAVIAWQDKDDAGIRISMTLYLSKKLLKTPIPEKVFKKLFINKRSKRLRNYLIDKDSNKIQNKSSKIRRLYVELASDNKNLIYNFVRRLSLIITSRIFPNK